MSRILFRPIMAKLIVIVILILPATLAAQSLWLPADSSGKTLMLEIFKPRVSRVVYNEVNYPVDYSFETFALFLSLHSQIGSKSFLVVELPFAHATFNAKIDNNLSFYRQSGYSNQVGNLYIGLKRINPKYIGLVRVREEPTSRQSIEFGLRLPFTKEGINYAAAVGRAADRERSEAFEHYTTLKMIFNSLYRSTHGWTYPTVRGVSGIALNRNSRRLYSTILINPLFLGYETTRFRIGVNFPIFMEAIYQESKKSNAFKFNLTHHLGLTANVKTGNLRLVAYIQPAFLDSEQAGSLNPSSLGLNLCLQH